VFASQMSNVQLLVSILYIKLDLEHCVSLNKVVLFKIVPLNRRHSVHYHILPLDRIYIFADLEKKIAMF
jgi:hypothetical protein